MDEMKKKKQFELILQGKNGKEVTAPVVRPAIFGDDEEEEEKIDVTGSSRSVTALRTLKQAERLHELAKAEDPSIFDYDAKYEEDEKLKSQKMAEQKAKDEVRAPKYAEDMMLRLQRHELERVSLAERLQQKEREAENGKFADKEVFVTEAYRKQLEQVEKLREDEAYEARFNAMTAVEQQKVWQAGMSRTLLNDISRDGAMKPMNKDDKTENKERNTRKRSDSDGEKEKEEVDGKMERFEKLKEIVRKRNGPEQIDEFKARYCERKASGFVTDPV